MDDFFRKLLSSDLMPHGHCFLWQPGILWLNVCSDTLIAFAYFLIPLSLVHLVRKRRDLEFNWMYLMFGVFILSCGLTHCLSVWDVWHSLYRLEGLVKAITAVSSLVTALLLFRLIPVALTVPSPARLREEIDDRKRAEQQVRFLNTDLERRVEERTALLQRTNDALQRFAYIASHDLQEPIRTVKSMNQLLARDYRGKLDEKADRYIKFVVDASDRMQTLVTDLMGYARVLDENAPREITFLDTNGILNDVLKDLSTSISDSHAVITADVLPPVHADATQFKLILLNLIGNALKYTRAECRPAIKIAGQATEEGSQFSVQDNGVGIPPDHLEQIFVAFRRLHGREVPGSGVGLTICKDIVAGYNGSIWVQSEVGCGSTFFFSLPRPGKSAKELG